jgi:hypothetical protein
MWHPAVYAFLLSRQWNESGVTILSQFLSLDCANAPYQGCQHESSYRTRNGWMSEKVIRERWRHSFIYTDELSAAGQSCQYLIAECS